MSLSCRRCGGLCDLRVVAVGGCRCQHCGEPWPTLDAPFMVLTGAAGAGKSSMCDRLAGVVPGAVLVDGDVIEPDAASVSGPNPDYARFWGHLLRLGYEIARNGVAPVWCSVCLPDQILANPEIALFSRVEILALVLDRDALAARIDARPGGHASRANRDKHLTLNETLRSASVPRPHRLKTLDVTHTPIEHAAARVAAWLEERSFGSGSTQVM